MDMLGAKLLTGSIFFLVAVCFSLLPFCVIRRYIRKKVTTVAHRSAGHQILLVQCLYSLASGVLIGTCLIHLLPDSLQTFQEALRSRHPQNVSQPARVGTVNATDASSGEDSNPEQYPVAELLVAFGFIAVYMLDNGLKSCSKDEKAATYIDKGLNSCSKDEKAATYVDNDIADEDVAFLTPEESTFNQETVAKATDVCHTGLKSDRKRGHGGISKLQQMITGVTLKMPGSDVPYRQVRQTEAEDERLPAILEVDRTDTNSVDTRLPNTSLDSLADVKMCEADSSMFTPSSQTTVRKAGAWRQSSHLRCAALVVALCVHGFFDGIVVGLQTSVPVVLSLAFAISLHKSFVCVGLSLSLLRMCGKHTSTMSVYVCVLLFAIASPLGVFTSGVFLQEMFEETGSGRASMTPACLQSFAVGTFLYVAVLEVTERLQSTTLCVEIIKQIFLLVGFGLMAGLRALLGAS